MVVNIKKATLADKNDLLLAIMRMKNSVECITNEEMQEYMDRTYFCEINGDIVAVVTAIREVLTHTNVYPDKTITTNPNRYLVKFCLFDQYKLEYFEVNAERIMTRLLSELCADLSDWTVWIDIDYQVELNTSVIKESAIEVLTKAVTSNQFKPTVNRFSYIRLSPIDFGALH